jgi:hypothetical protein
MSVPKTKLPKDPMRHHVRVPWPNHKNLEFWNVEMSGAETFAMFHNAQICAVKSTLSTDGRISTLVCLMVDGESQPEVIVPQGETSLTQIDHFCRVKL